MATIHTMPVDDMIEHVPYDNCICGPTTRLIVDDEEGEEFFQELHHSLDGREFRRKKPKYESVDGDLMAFKPFKKGNKSGTKKKKGGKKGPPASVLNSKSPKTPSRKRTKAKGRRKKK